MTPEKLFSLMVNVYFQKNIFTKEEPTFGDILEKVKRKGGESFFFTDAADCKTIHLTKASTIFLSRTENVVCLRGCWPIHGERSFEKKRDLLMTVLIMHTWNIQRERIHRHLIGGKWGRGILPFRGFDFKGFKKNLYLSFEDLKEMKIDPGEVLSAAEAFHKWNGK